MSRPRTVEIHRDDVGYYLVVKAGNGRATAAAAQRWSEKRGAVKAAERLVPDYGSVRVKDLTHDGTRRGRDYSRGPLQEASA